MPPRESPDVRFWRKVEKTADCWMWTAGKKSDGYGLFWSGSRKVGAHRWAYEALVGPVPAGLQLDHLCRNRACVNPAHLEPVTSRENTRRGNAGLHMAVACALITHCINGHEFTTENTYKGYLGRRKCRACNRGHAKRRRQALTLRGDA